MIEPIEKSVKVSVTPTISELVNIIWNMGCEEQAELLHKLACWFDCSCGYEQMLYTADEIVKHGYPNTVGMFVDRLHEYLGTKPLVFDKKRRCKNEDSN